MLGVRVCFIGGSQYKSPLDRTSEKKFRALIQIGEIYVIGFSPDAKLRHFKQHAQFYLLPRVQWGLFRYLLMLIFGQTIAVWCILRWGVHILIAQSPYEGFAAACAKIIVRPLGKRVALVVESHGDFEVSLFLQRRVFYPSVYRFLMRQSALFALRHADVLRAVSNSTKEQLEKWAPNKPIFQFVAWTDMDVFLEAGAKKKRNPNEKMIIYAGVLIPGKGVHFLLDAFGNITSEGLSTKLWIIGNSENREYAEMLKGKVERLSLGNRVIFSDSLPQPVLADLIAQAQVLVLPSLSEGLGRVIFEAMACGTPVIGSAVGGIMEMIVDGENGFLIPSGDVDSLVDRLRWILKNPEKAYEMGKRAREFAEDFFSAKGYVENYRNVIEAAGKHI